jgi:hypothetical protein
VLLASSLTDEIYGDHLSNPLSRRLSSALFSLVDSAITSVAIDLGHAMVSVLSPHSAQTFTVKSDAEYKTTSAS